MRHQLTDFQRTAVQMAVGGLDTREQRIVRQRFWQQLSLGEIARRMRATVQRVEELLREALRQVRMTLELLFGFDFS